MAFFTPVSFAMRMAPTGGPPPFLLFFNSECGREMGESLDLRLKAWGFGPRERERTHARQPPMETMENDRRAAYCPLDERTKHSN